MNDTAQSTLDSVNDNVHANEAMPLILKKDDKCKSVGPEGSASQLQLYFNIVTGGLGTGIFTLPWSTAGASIIPAIIIVALVLSLNAWTISILVQAAERFQTFDLGSLLAHLPGRYGHISQVTCNVGVWASLYLVLVSYTIVAADCVKTTLFPDSVMMRRWVLVTLTSAVVLPLCFLDQSRLVFSSAMGIAVTLNIFVYIVVHLIQSYAGEHIPPGICVFGLSTGSIAMISAMMQAVIIQMCVLPMYGEMKNRTPAKFNMVVISSFSSLFFIFAGFSVAGYLAFGENVQSNVLLSLPDTSWGHASRLSAALAVVAVYPIMMSPMIAPIRNSEALASLPEHLKSTAANAGVVFVVVTVTGAAYFISDLGLLNVVNGAMSLGVFVALVPGLVGVFLIGTVPSVVLWRTAMAALVIAGIVFSILGLIYTNNYVQSLHAACRWGT